MRVSRKNVFIVLAVTGAALLMFGLLAGCSNSGTKSGKEIAATVDGTEITVAQLDAEMAKLKLQNPEIFNVEQGGMDEATVRSSMLDELINQQLLTAKAQAEGIKVDDTEIQKQIDSLKAGYGGEEQFNAALKSAGFTLETLKENYRWQILSSELLNSLVPETSVTDADVAKYYEDNKASMKVDAAKRASHILFDTKDKQSAKDVLAELKAGGDFEALAKQYSKDEGSATNGGDLGWPTAPYVSSFQKALDKLDKGEMSELVNSEYGWHIIRVTDVRKAGVATLEDKKEEIRQTLLNEKRSAAYQTLLNDLRTAAKIEILDPKVKAAGTPAQSEKDAAPAKESGATDEDAAAE